MNDLKYLLIAFLLILITGFSNGQETTPQSTNNSDFHGLYAGGVASTNGWGGELKYLLTKHFTVKAGFEKLNLSYDFSFDENDIDYDATMDYLTGGIFLLADFNYTKNLYVSGGILFNSFKPELTGTAASSLEFGDISIPASEVGDFHFSLSPDLKISPYGGVGVRSFLGKRKKVALNFETGIYYMGPPQIDIEATGLLAPTADPAHQQKEIFEKQLEQYKFYPVVKLNLAVKLF